MNYICTVRKIYKESRMALFYPCFLIVCFLQAYFGFAGGFPGSGYVMWPFRIFLLILGLNCFFRNFLKLRVLGVFILYSIFSFLLVLLYDFPIELYFIEFFAFVLPMFSAYVALRKNEDIELTYRIMFISWSLCFLLGFFLYFIRPVWYQNALIFVYNNRWEMQTNISYSDVADTFRFSSFLLDSYPISHFTMFLMPLSISYLLRAKKRQWFYFSLVILIFFTSLLSMHRASIIGCTITVLVLFFYDFIREKRLGKYALLIAFLVLILASYFSQTELYDKLSLRISEISINSAFDDSRKAQNENLFAILKNIILGSGIGSGSSNARRIGLVGISDGNYMKLLYEQGVVGLVLFFSVLIASLVRAFKNFKYYSVEFCILVSILIAMLGSDSLTMPFYILPFWYSIGVIWNKSYLIRRIKENYYI